jgi:hypothetical protein
MTTAGGAKPGGAAAGFMRKCLIGLAFRCRPRRTSRRPALIPFANRARQRESILALKLCFQIVFERFILSIHYLFKRVRANSRSWRGAMRPFRVERKSFIDRESVMARFEMRETELSGLGTQNVPGDVFFQLGINYSTGRGVAADMVAAHKWFNLAAAKGNAEAARYRKELAAEMASTEVAEAQRQAREWISLH